jgi:hypothetical protein
MLLLVMVMVVMVGVGWRVVLGPTSAARRRTAGGRRAHVSTGLHLLPSRQMPAIVHHAGLGWWCCYCGSCSLDVRATAARLRESEGQQVEAGMWWGQLERELRGMAPGIATLIDSGRLVF